MLLSLAPIIKNDIKFKIQNKKIKAKIQRYRNMKNQNKNRQKCSFPKEQVEHADSYKPALNKTMTTCKQCIKYNFVAPLLNVILHGLL